LAWLGLPRTLGLAWGYYLGMKTRNLWLGLGQLINLVSKQETLGLAWHYLENKENLAEIQ
jgi:hypothetical protein